MHKNLENIQIEDGLHVYISTQEMHLYKENKLLKKFSVSTSQNKPSCIANSFGTPLGRHRISQKIGAGQPFGMVFVGRQPTQTYMQVPSSKGLISSRILWLEGLQESYNKGETLEGEDCDTFNRYIYIHGTNKEEQIGKPVSQGCINMLNQDIIELYEMVSVGTLVCIYA